MSAPREQNAGEQYPEVAPMSATWNAYDSSYEHYHPHRSPAPEYQQYPASPPLSSSSPRLSAASPPPEVGHTQSPSVSDGGFRSSVKSRQTHFSEYLSPDPQIAYTPSVPAVQEKEYYNKNAQANAVPAFHSQQHDALPPSQPALQSGEEKKRPFYKRKLCIVLGVVILLIIILAAVLGGVLGSRKKSSSDTSSPSTSNQTIITGDPDTAVGGYLSPSYYSKSGAFNGSGLATAGANPGEDLSAYVFYQTYTGDLQWKLLKEDGSYSQTLGVINDPSSTPLNGTPMSIVNIKLNDTFSSYYLFYIDQDYYINQRILQTGGGVSGGSVVPVWTDGPVTELKLKTLEADMIGLQACPWKDFYGPWSPNDTTPTEGLHLWYATDETTFQQYNWHNGTDDWVKDQEWTGMDGHAGVGCQTWESWMFEYVFFVDSSQNLAGYWIDNNRTTVSTTSHPTRQWTKMANVNFPNVAKSTSLGYTNYLLYQAEDTSIRGANITFDSENSGVADTFTVTELNGDQDVSAIRGTHLTITALKTPSGGAELGIFFQQDGDEVSVYTRDQSRHTGGWQQADSAVRPSGSG